MGEVKNWRVEKIAFTITVAKLPLMVKDEECSSCLTVKPILYCSRYDTCYGYLELHECSACRMNFNSARTGRAVTMLEPCEPSVFPEDER